MGGARIRSLQPADWPTVEQIHRDGIATGHATFESEPPDWTTFDAERIRDVRLVATIDDAVVGWVAASHVSNRAVYRGVLEHSLYIAPTARGHGIGGALLTAFIAAADDAGFWTIQSSVFPENVASLRLHEKAGFRVVGRREAIARMSYGPYAGRWRDTILIERRHQQR
ncbi:N-acetyltransferase family protein [Microbacteriaceae bacterium VKM Ac-2855]|nr:N-acetyltransferase family protein [Microbacteriaceae bacterium VKM Ac-2855]